MVFKNIEEIPKEYKLNSPIVIDEILIEGEFKKWDGDFSDVISPIRIYERDELKKKVIGKFPLMQENEVCKILNEAVNAYDDGAGQWPCMSAESRLDYFYKFVNELKKYRNECINVLMWEIAKSLKDATAEFDRTIDYIIDSIEQVKKFERESYPKNISGLIVEEKRSPLGVVFVMGPYNYPLNETFANIIPALLMGNTVLVKPPKRGSLIYYYVLKAIEKSFPKGIFNVIFGRGNQVVEPIMKTGLVSVFAFIGAHSTANLISSMHPKPNRLKSVYGLDAKNLAIILKDADIEIAVNEVIAGSLSYNGQRCTALKLIYVHKSIKEKFLSEYVKKVDSLKSGIPFDNPKITPVPDERVEIYNDFVSDALSKGAKIINNPACDVETFFSVKVLDNVTSDMKIFNEEQFGPVVPIVDFEDLSEPINTIKKSHYGQQCSVFGQDSKEVGHLIDFLVNQVSRVNINAQSQRGPDVLPFTGRKDSASGVLSVTEALKTFSIETLVTMRATDVNKELYRKMAEKDSEFLKREYLF